MENAKFQPAFVWTGDPASVNEQTPHLPGQLGITVEIGNKKWQYVQLDSGATASNTVGVVAARDVAFWKDRTSYLVTNDLRFSEAGRNGVAGIFPVAVTAGYYCFIQRGGRASVGVGTGTAAAGATCVAHTGTGADVAFIAEATAPTCIPIGVGLGAAVNSVASVELLLDPIK